MQQVDSVVVVGLDNGGTSNNVTVLDSQRGFLIDSMLEFPSNVVDGPAVAIESLAEALDQALAATSTQRSALCSVGLDTPGPSSADGVISSRGGTNFVHSGWYGFDVRAALERRIGVPVVYNNDGNAAALYAHHAHYGAGAARRSSVSAIVGTGLGGGVIEAGAVVRGAAGMAGELGHVHIPLFGVIEADQPMPVCNCGFEGDAESVASLTGIKNNLLPYWLTRFPHHELANLPIDKAAKALRGWAEQGDPMALKIFEQQAKALGRLFTIAANFTDPDAYFVGGGVVEADPTFRDWFLATIRQHTMLREEQANAAVFALVPDLDMAGARGSAIAAMATLNQ
jgi:glucokinase